MTRRGVYTPGKINAYKESLAAKCMVEMRRLGIERIEHGGVSAVITYYFKRPKSRQAQVIARV